MNPNIEKKPVSESSGSTGIKIEKYLYPNETAVYSTKGCLEVMGKKGLKGYVTNNRVMFHASRDSICESDYLFAIPLDRINFFEIVEDGWIGTGMFLQLNDQRIMGDKSEILELYKAILAAKNSVP